MIVVYREMGFVMSVRFMSVRVAGCVGDTGHFWAWREGYDKRWGEKGL